MDGSTGSPVLHSLLEPAQIHVHRVSDAVQPSHPLPPASPPALNLSQHQGQEESRCPSPPEGPVRTGAGAHRLPRGCQDGSRCPPPPKGTVGSTSLLTGPHTGVTWQALPLLPGRAGGGGSLTAPRVAGTLVSSALRGHSGELTSHQQSFCGPCSLSLGVPSRDGGLVFLLLCLLLSTLGSQNGLWCSSWLYLRAPHPASSALHAPQGGETPPRGSTCSDFRALEGLAESCSPLGCSPASGTFS